MSQHGVRDVDDRDARRAPREQRGERGLGVVREHGVEGIAPVRADERAGEREIGERLARARARVELARRERSAHERQVRGRGALAGSVTDERHAYAGGGERTRLLREVDLRALRKRKREGADECEVHGGAQSRRSRGVLT